MPAPLTLPAELTIYGVAELRPQWRAWVDAGRAAAPADQAAPALCDVDGAAVSEVDAAGVQLLLSLSQSLAQDHRKLRVMNPSSVLAKACEALGVKAALLSGDVSGGAA